MTVHLLCHEAMIIRIEGRQEEVDRGLESLRGGDTVYDTEEKFEAEGCEVEIYP